MAFYNEKPSALEAVGNGSYLYRFNIKEVTPDVSEGEEQTESMPLWECDEVTVWAPLTSNKITAAVITVICPASHEQKLINEYNAAILGMVGGSKTSAEAKARIAVYKQFLEYRTTLKDQVDTDCVAFGIK